MIPDDTKDEIREAVDRGVLALDAYEQRFKERFGMNTGVALAVDAFMYVTALYVFFNFTGLHIIIKMVLFAIALFSVMGAVKKAMKITRKAVGNR